MNQIASCVTTREEGNHHDRDYNAFLVRIESRFLKNSANSPLFTTNVENLWDLYLGSFTDPEERQHHNCHACRHFITRFGGLATISGDGTVEPAVWTVEDASDGYHTAITAMAQAVRRAKITGVFLSSATEWGTPVTGQWCHLSVKPNPAVVFKKSTKTAWQAMAEKAEDFKTVMTALTEFTQPHIETALTLLKTDSLYRSEKVLGQAEWLYALHVARSAAVGSKKTNVIWKAVATAPAGFCHPRSSMIGTLLEDIAAGKNFNEVSRAFAAKMHPLSYQRPQASPTAGAIAEAEKIMEKLGAAGSLARRFARVGEIQALWRPLPKKEGRPSGGVFGHLKPKGEVAVQMNIPPQTMTWDKFYRIVLPTAERIELLAPHHGSYTALVTAVNIDAPPIIQWDTEENRNPVSWYLWVNGASATQFGLCGEKYYDVSAVTLKPSMWSGGFGHHGDGVIFIISEAHETKSVGACLFPEILKSEFHGIRSVIEAYSRQAKIEGVNDPHAAGIMLSKGSNGWGIIVRAWVGDKFLDYKLDRWD